MDTSDVRSYGTADGSVGAALAEFDGTAADGNRLRHLASTLHDGIEQLLRMGAPLVTAVRRCRGCGIRDGFAR
jgi:hypothetical protein